MYTKIAMIRLIIATAVNSYNLCITTYGNCCTDISNRTNLHRLVGIESIIVVRILVYVQFISAGLISITTNGIIMLSIIIIKN